MRDFRFFLSVWDYVLADISFAGSVAASEASDEIAMHPLRGHGVHRSLI